MIEEFRTKQNLYTLKESIEVINLNSHGIDSVFFKMQQIGSIK